MPWSTSQMISKNSSKKKKYLRPRKKKLFYRPDRPLFCPFAEFFFFYKKYYKISHFFEKKLFQKNVSKASKIFWIFKWFLGQFGKKKIHPTDRPLFEICSPVEQGFFSWPKCLKYKFTIQKYNLLQQHFSFKCVITTILFICSIIFFLDRVWRGFMCLYIFTLFTSAQFCARNA